MDTQQTNLYESVLIASLVLGVILVYFCISVIRQQRLNLALRKKNMLSEIAGLEKERARIASDLHDELGPLLSAVKIKINSFELTDPEDHLQLAKTNDHIDDVLQRMREISFDLMPATLLKKGLFRAVVEYVDFLHSQSDIQFTFLNETDWQIDEAKSVNIYRIIREVTHNALKHARATEIRIEFTGKPGKIRLAIRDNGRGFDYKKELAENPGIGLRSISNRTQIAGGRMFVESSEKGTAYLFEIPL